MHLFVYTAKNADVCKGQRGSTNVHMGAAVIQQGAVRPEENWR